MGSAKVIIAGGGPVGMTLAYVLAEYGVHSVLFERNPSTTSHPKMDITNSRSMELFHKIGLADALRAVAVDEDNPFDVSWITRLNGHELHRFPYDGAAGVRRQMREQNDGTQPSEPPMRVSQVIIEPVLKKAIEAHPLVDVRFGVAFEHFEETSEGVIAHVRNSDGIESTVSGDWLVGCDGGGSRVREQMNIGLSGRARVSHRFITHFRSDARHLLQRWGKAWHYQSNRGTLVAQNDHDVWTLLSRFPEGVELENVDPSALITDFVGEPIEHEVLVSNAWFPHLLVADSYGRGRVWLAGDSAHQYIPTGGYGMNTGIGDAFDIGWKLASIIQGFGDASLMESYEAERRPIGLANCEGSGRHNDVRVAVSKVYSDLLLEETPAGEAARREAGEKIGALGNAENESFGLELGYSYDASGIVHTDPAAEISRDPLHYRPSTAPGVRLPSVYLADGSNMYEHIAPWFTLLCFEEECDGAGMKAAAEALGVPLDVVRVDISGHEAIYKGPAVLVRPDQHIAWRGTPPADISAAESLLKVCLGRK